MSAALGEPLDIALAVLGVVEHTKNISSLEAALRSESRETRARAIAQNLAPIAHDLEAMEATWRV